MTRSVNKISRIIFLFGIVGQLVDCKQNESKKYEYDYYKDGHIKTKCYLRNDLLEDTSIVYYESGKIHKIELWHDSKLNGNASYYYKNGKLNAKGQYKDSLKVGVWYYYDTVGNLTAQKEYLIINKSSILNKYWYNDSGYRCLYYSVLPKIHSIDNADTLYDFIIHLRCNDDKMGRVVYGKLDDEFRDFSKGGKFKVFSKADTVYSNNNNFLISNIDCKDLSHLKGYVQTYHYFGDSLSFQLSYFLFSRSPQE
jgi:hypothetical protein